MAKQFLVDWQDDSVVVAVSPGGGAKVALEKVNLQVVDVRAPADVTPDSNGDFTVNEQPVNRDIAQALCRAVDLLGLRKSDATVIVSRELVEVRTISVPRVDPQELPDIIRFQAQRQLANMGDSWTLDYVLLPEEPGQEMLTALVAVISPQVMQEIDAACAQAGLQVAHIAFRPIEIVRHAKNSGNLPDFGSAIIVCLSDQYADLLTVKNGALIQVRGTKLPHDPNEMAAALNGELRRSLMAAATYLGSQPLSGAMLIGSPELCEDVRQVVTDVAGCQVFEMNPAEFLPAAFQVKQEFAQTSANRIAALCGAGTLVAADAKTKVDFKQPKKRPPPKSKTGLYILAATAALLLIGGGYAWWWITNAELDSDLAFYQSEVEGKKDLEKIAKSRIANLREVQNFLEASPNWLDELNYIADRMPPAEKARIAEPSFSVNEKGQGLISFPVAFDSSESIKLFEDSLRDENHNVVASKNIVQGKGIGLYEWFANATITVKDRGWKLVDQLNTTRVQTPKTETTEAATTEAATTEAETIESKSDTSVAATETSET